VKGATLEYGFLMPAVMMWLRQSSIWKAEGARRSRLVTPGR